MPASVSSERDLAPEVHLVPCQWGHARTRALQAQHNASLEVVLGPAELLVTTRLAPDPAELHED